MSNLRAGAPNVGSASAHKEYQPPKKGERGKRGQERKHEQTEQKEPVRYEYIVFSYLDDFLIRFLVNLNRSDDLLDVPQNHVQMRIVSL